MPRWDYICKACGYVDTNVTMSNWREAVDTPVFCPAVDERGVACCFLMERIPSAANFSVKGYNASNHYGAKRED